MRSFRVPGEGLPFGLEIILDFPVLSVCMVPLSQIPGRLIFIQEQVTETHFRNKLQNVPSEAQFSFAAIEQTAKNNLGSKSS